MTFMTTHRAPTITRQPHGDNLFFCFSYILSICRMRMDREYFCKIGHRMNDIMKLTILILILSKSFVIWPEPTNHYINNSLIKVDTSYYYHAPYLLIWPEYGKDI